LGRRAFSFQTLRGSLAEVLTDRDLAALGDAFVNFAYSLALSNRRRKPLGVRVKGSLLAEGLRRAGLRDCLGGRMTRHALADAAEALIAYAWLNGYVTLDECVTVMGKTEDAVEGLSALLTAAKKKATFP
jgi:hypothetical protein